MTYDSFRGVAFLFGGYHQVFNYYNTVAELGHDSDCDGTIDALESQTAVQWRSLRTHSGYGELGIVLNGAATGNGATGPSVETRGVNANAGVRKIAIDFSGPVALLDPAQISVTYWTTIDPSTISAAQTLTPTNVQMTGPQTLTFDLVGAPEEACYSIALQPGLTTATITGDSDCMLRSLAGDANMDGIVDNADLDITRDRIGASVVDYPELDFTLSAGIGLADMSYCKSRFTHLVLCPTP